MRRFLKHERGRGDSLISRHNSTHQSFQAELDYLEITYNFGKILFLDYPALTKSLTSKMTVIFWKSDFAVRNNIIKFLFRAHRKESVIFGTIYLSTNWPFHLHIDVAIYIYKGEVTEIQGVRK